MAQYDTPITGSDVSESLREVLPSLTPETLTTVTEYLTQTANQIYIATHDPDTNTVTFTNQTTGEQIIVLGEGGVEITFNTVERMIVTGIGNDRIVVTGDRDTIIESTGGNDFLQTSGGNDNITTSIGADTVFSGAGSDTVHSIAGNDSIDAGSGFDMVMIEGDRENYTVEVVDGALIVDNSAGHQVTIKNAEFISFDDGSSLTVGSDASISTVLRMYEGVLDRSAASAGAEYWTDIYRGGQASLVDIAWNFLNSQEFTAKHGVYNQMDNEAFVRLIFDQALDRAPAQAGLDHYVGALEAGVRHEHVVWSIVGSVEAQGVHQGTVVTIDGWI